MRIVADTSTIVSGVLWSGLSHRIIELVEAGILTLCVTPEILQEYREVLARPKFARKLQDRLTTVEEIMQTLLPHVELYSDAPLVSAVQPDPGDNMFLSCALSADAEYLVSGDSHLLDLIEFVDIQIVTARQFLEREFPYLLADQ
jgi:putative PIN family toxin of toxin-antitoxin system